MKSFQGALKDNFEHVTELSDPALLKQYRDEGVLVDEEGFYRIFKTIDEVRVEPFGDEEGEYLIAVYHNGILMLDKLRVCTKKS